MVIGYTMAFKKIKKKLGGKAHMDSNILMIKINISGVISCKFMRQLRVNMTVQIWKKYSPNRKSTQNNCTRGFLMTRLKERGRVTDQ